MWLDPNSGFDPAQHHYVADNSTDHLVDDTSRCVDDQLLESEYGNAYPSGSVHTAEVRAEEPPSTSGP
jgi:hypothetical protein